MTCWQELRGRFDIFISAKVEFGGKILRNFPFPVGEVQRKSIHPCHPVCGADSQAAVRRFREDPNVAKVIRDSTHHIIQGFVNKHRYNTCLGLLAARLMYL